MGNDIAKDLQLETAGRSCRVILDLCQGNQQLPSMFMSYKVAGCMIAVRLCWRLVQGRGSIMMTRPHTIKSLYMSTTDKPSLRANRSRYEVLSSCNDDGCVCLEIKLHTWRTMLLVRDSKVKVATVDKHQVLWATRTVSKGASVMWTWGSLPFNILRIFSVLCSCPTSTI